MKSETLTLVLVYLAGIMERADESLLPGVYKEVGDALHVDPTALGTLTLFRSIVQSSCYPLAAYLSSRHNRAHVIALGAFLWATATFLVAVSTTFFQVAVSRGLNGIGLAIVTPAIQSLVADSTEDNNRGMAFGWLGFTSNIGSILGYVFSILFASKSFNGVAGWRIAFLLVAFVSVIVGILVRLFATDPHYSDRKITKHVKDKPFWSDIRDLLQEAKMVIKIPSFQIFVAQGVSGSFPWSAFAFAPLWLELIGFSHKTTAVLVTLFTISCSLGGLFGGYMGDTLAKKFPNAGRIILSQISSASAIPLAAILLIGLPDDPSTAFSHGLVLVIMGLCISWNGPATNGPIFAEIVPERARTSIYALDRSFESILASFAPPIVGMLAQNIYGYKPIPKGSSSLIKIETDRENAASLAKALYTAIGIPMVICCTIYSFLYCTYPRDRDRAKLQALIESEMQQLNEEEEEEIDVKSSGAEEHDETYLLKQHQNES
uniref:AT5G10190-like protein n=1 Tax=Arabidopsis arenosa TaxID=38785 RepID=B7U9S3_ARAAE|nr:AT5G10190-like protein [Arabidopsis arenosa]